MKSIKLLKTYDGLILNCPCGFTHRWEHGKDGYPTLLKAVKSLKKILGKQIDKSRLAFLNQVIAEMKEVA